MDRTKLAQIVDAHRLWLRDLPGGTRANLYGANLSGADLSRANLYGANLSGADLSRANLYGANLSDADLSRANLYGANLSGADLSRADLYGANLSGADLATATLPYFSICPEVGDFTAFKKLRDGIIATLVIPADARRTSSLVGRKCRAEFARVVSLVDAAGGPVEIGHSKHDYSFTYRVGETVTPDSFDDDIRAECRPGIHFFVTRREAENY